MPLLSGLADARQKDHKEALTEVGLNVGLSTVPIWFGTILMLAAPEPGNFFTLIVQNMQSGEL